MILANKYSKCFVSSSSSVELVVVDGTGCSSAEFVVGVESTVFCLVLLLLGPVNGTLMPKSNNCAVKLLNSTKVETS